METFAFEVACTPCPAYEFGYNEHLAITSRFLCIIGLRVMIKCCYNQHPLKTISFFCIVSLVVGPSANFSAKELCGQC